MMNSSILAFLDTWQIIVAVCLLIVVIVLLKIRSSQQS
jgi:hypothetical protein